MKIYGIFNKITEDIYIGSTSLDLIVRWRLHKNKKNCRLLNEAIKHYGDSAFEIFEIESCSKSESDLLEADYIKKYNTLYPNGYNLRSAGVSSKHHSESIKKFKLVQKEVYKRNWGNGIYPGTGTKRTLEQRKIISDSHKGLKHTKEQTKKISEKNSIKIKCKETGDSFNSITEAAKHYGLPLGTFHSRVMRGYYKKFNLTFEFWR